MLVMKTNARWMAATVFGALVLAFGAGLYTGVSDRTWSQVFAQTGVTLSLQGLPVDAKEFEQFWHAWRILQDNYVASNSSSTVPTTQEMVYGAIKGLTESYGDPYTVFLPPTEAQQFAEDLSGTFSGVGMELGQRESQLTVIAPLRGTPAERAGMRSGDRIRAIDGKSTEGMSVEEAVKLIRGPKGTEVVLMVERAGESSLLEIAIVRDTINVPLIETYMEGGVFTIELYSFSQNSAELFRQALREYFESGATKLILDLRGNPGGYLEASVQMASFFLPVGEVVVTEDFQGGRTNVVHRSVGYNVFANKQLSMVVLVDQGSASASEILAGALQQQGVATLIGSRTFGKGSVQQLIELGGGAELKVTIARWLTPNGSSISDGGLVPDIEVERTAEDFAAGRDPQRAAALLWLAGR